MATASQLSYLDPVDVPVNSVQHWQVGPLKLWLSHRPGEWHLQSSRTPEEEDATAIERREAAPPEIERQRWLVAAETDRVRLQLVLPDRPVVVRPEMAVNLAPGTESLFYVLVPGAIRVLIGNTPTAQLSDVPTVVLSNTYFGEVTGGGELCYAMRTKARRDLDPGSWRPHRVICPLKLRNEATDEPLGFERFCLRVAPLAVYRGDVHLWTNLVTVRCLPKGGQGEMKVADGPPPEAPDATRVAEPRAPKSSWLSGRGIRSIASFFS